MNQHAAGDFPQIATSSYGANTQWIGSLTSDGTTVWDEAINQLGDLKRRVIDPWQRIGQEFTAQELNQNQMSTRRIVKVFIADPHPDMPLEAAILYKGEEKFTDATDQELFFEIPIKELLDARNAIRVKTIDKEASKRAGKDVFLEPARIRDLKMVVVEIAKF